MRQTAPKSNKPLFRPEAEVSPGRGLRSTVRRAGYLRRTRGLAGLVAGCYRYVRSLRRLIYVNVPYYVYETRLGDGVALDYPPPVDGCELHILESADAAEALFALGYEDFRRRHRGARRALRAGGIAVCTYVGHEFASIDWIALSPSSLFGMARVAHRHTFRDGHACTTNAFTVPEFRNAHLGSYRLAGALRYVRDHGYTHSDAVIAVHNMPSRRCIERFGGRVVRAGRYLRLLTLHRWTVHAVTEPVVPVPVKRPQERSSTNDSDPG